MVDCKDRGYILSVVPIEAKNILEERLWPHTSNVLLCSATLSSVGTFRLFQLESGYPDNAKVFKVASPFDYSKSTLCIPKLFFRSAHNLLGFLFYQIIFY